MGLLDLSSGIVFVPLTSHGSGVVPWLFHENVIAPFGLFFFPYDCPGLSISLDYTMGFSLSHKRPLRFMSRYCFDLR